MQRILNIECTSSNGARSHKEYSDESYIGTTLLTTALELSLVTYYNILPSRVLLL